MLNRRLASFAVASLLATTGSALAQSPDVTYQDLTDVGTYGPETISGSVTYAYIFGTATCNIGNRNLNWGNATQGSPVVFFNMFRYHDGRLQQIGAGWGKTACCAAAGSGCGSCNGAGGAVLGAGCRDVYGSGWNAQQSRLGPRSNVNPWSGQQVVAPSFAGTSPTARRCSVKREDMDPTRYPGAIYFGDGVYVANDEVTPSTRMNNASYRRVNLAAGTYSATLAATTVQGQPAIAAWRAQDPTVAISTVDAPNDGRFYVASKARDLGNGQWRYDYAVYNLNSHNGAMSFTVPLPVGARISNIGFSDVAVAGETWSTDDWTNSRTSCAITWSTQNFATNPNANALRFATMYNFWFDSDAAPATNRSVSIGLFRVAGSISATDLTVPGRATCIADVDNGTGSGIPDGGVTIDDLLFYLTQYENGSECPADVDNGNGTGTPDGGVTIDDLLYYLDRFANGC